MSIATIRRGAGCSILSLVLGMAIHGIALARSPLPVQESGPAATAQGRALLTGDAPGTTSPLSPGLVIACFGDSITYLDGYRSLLQRAVDESPHTGSLKVKVLERGLNGAEVEHLRDGGRRYGDRLDPFDAVLARDLPDVVTLFIGANDVRNRPGTPLDEFTAVLGDLADRARKRVQARVVLCTVWIEGERTDGKNPLDAKLDRYAEAVRRLAERKGCTLVDLRREALRYLKANNPDQKSKGVLTYDGLHPGPAGNVFLADRIAFGIREALLHQTAIPWPEGPPEPPIRLRAEARSPTRIRLTWEDRADNEAGYRIHRHDTPGTEGTLVDRPLAADVTQYLVTGLDPEQSYTFSLRAFHRGGRSIPSAPVTVRTPSRRAPVAGKVLARESFTRAGALHGRSGGTGWDGPWSVKGSAEVYVGLGNLDLEGLPARGGSMRIEADSVEDTVRVTRRLVRLPAPATEGPSVLWLGFRIRADRKGRGSLLIRLGENRAAGVVACHGDRFGIDDRDTGRFLTLGKSHLVVARYLLREGPDDVRLWIDPPLNTVPLADHAHARRDDMDLGAVELLDLELKSPGKGNYTLDELRLGDGFGALIGLEKDA